MQIRRWNAQQAVILLAGLIFLALASTALPAQTLPEGMPGRYVLTQAAGHPLPYTPVEPGRPADAPAPEIVAGTLVVHPDGRFVGDMAARLRQGGTEHFFTNPMTGTITRDSAGFVMHWDGAGITPAQWQAERFSFVNEDQEYVYVRQGPPRPSGK